MIFGTKKGDRRVQNLLELLELKYSIDQDGDFKVIVEFNDGRSQVAFIDSDTQNIGDFEIREIWSVAYVSEGFLDIDTANTLLLHNHQLKMGSWRLIPGEDNTFLATFCVQISADCDPESFGQALGLVLETADEMEEKLTGRDHL
ncbi:hypothetical protein C7H19_19350 [Aphanothece hegewaldii CCALA 016]|uniref:YbjN domain-containing protein n=1 Tax=Aphanothece hegewaldii CCALA 016 TaxID=2107694 RepID=A0A2T1LTA7_9CHRO|nr:hypothetical protein [Aphanothece hegewaldii]PSF33881.1 hypothetical protein C7H19_19350 [Aphanothece hegewaldii CCALA 016]